MPSRPALGTASATALHRKRVMMVMKLINLCIHGSGALKSRRLPLIDAQVVIKRQAVIELWRVKPLRSVQAPAGPTDQ